MKGEREREPASSLAAHSRPVRELSSRLRTSAGCRALSRRRQPVAAGPGAAASRPAAAGPGAAASRPAAADTLQRATRLGRRHNDGCFTFRRLRSNASTAGAHEPSSSRRTKAMLQCSSSSRPATAEATTGAPSRASLLTRSTRAVGQRGAEGCGYRTQTEPRSIHQ
jgi:hypothetical protein